MDDDFNTAQAMGHLFDIARTVNSLPEDAPGTVENTAPTMKEAKGIFDTLGTGVFGIAFETEAPAEGLADDLMGLIIAIRAQARNEKNWALSDRIRDRLGELGITLEDRPDGTTREYSGNATAEHLFRQPTYRALRNLQPFRRPR
jgi:cysteinyl-tRNA synthetase